MPTRLPHTSERRAEFLLNDLLTSQGWDMRRPPRGDLVVQNECRAFPEIKDALSDASKSGLGPGVPEAILIDSRAEAPLAVIETKRFVEEERKAINEAQFYGDALFRTGWRPLAIGLAGTSDDAFRLRVSKRTEYREWIPVTYEGTPINWIPNRTDLERVSALTESADIRPTIPPLSVLASRANEINRLLREARVKDEYRPAVVAAAMLALWQSQGDIRRDPEYILGDINQSCEQAYRRVGRLDLAKSLRIDEANDKLKRKARRIATILERLNITVLTAEHDYLGQLYETFFRYTGGNTIGQYFTPRHITRLMADVCEVSKDDIVIDPACGTGGFLVSCMDRILQVDQVSRSQIASIVRRNLIGFEDEPVTAALCFANMVLRGDGSTGIHKADCLTSEHYPKGTASVALMNPPFPHKKTDTPVEEFVDRALEGLSTRGRLATIIPTGLLVKPATNTWRRNLLEKHSLLAVCQLPDELFQPFASATTSFIVIEKGVPHNPDRKAVFVRLHHDGLSLHKGTRIEAGPNQIPEAIDSILNRKETPGFSGMGRICANMEWGAGAYIESVTPIDEEVFRSTDILLRRFASFYTRYAKEIIQQRRAVSNGDIQKVTCKDIFSRRKLSNAESRTGEDNEVGGLFDIYYGMQEIESRKGIPPGDTLIISPTEEYNGCYGWLEFGKAISPPFITVARTGSIGEAFVHAEPCAPNSDCLILIPRKRLSMADLFLATSALRLENWRYNYGRKITPDRIKRTKIPRSSKLRSQVESLCNSFQGVIAASLVPYRTEKDVGMGIAENMSQKVRTDATRSTSTKVSQKVPREPRLKADYRGATPEQVGRALLSYRPKHSRK